MSRVRENRLDGSMRRREETKPVGRARAARPRRLPPTLPWKVRARTVSVVPQPDNQALGRTLTVATMNGVAANPRSPMPVTIALLGANVGWKQYMPVAGACVDVRLAEAELGAIDLGRIELSQADFRGGFQTRI